MWRDNKGHCCKGCKDRQLHCHSTCDRYLAFVQANEAEKQERVKQTDFNNLIYGNMQSRYKSLANQKSAGTKHKGMLHGVGHKGGAK